ncbi:MAG: hypothetical protein IAG13_17040 [Deltaproteobacteria bacterium]|nr:hypothetical protein [Nannocystaceae bacterium]
MLLPVCLALAFAASPGVARRGNDAISREQGPVFSVAASPRLGILLGDGRRVIQPTGFGAGLQFRVHALRLGPLRFGGELQLGHTRYLDDRQVATPTGGEARRYAVLGHTDFAIGPSIQIVMGPIFAELGVAGGLGISTFVRPLGPFNLDEQQVDDYTGMIRGGGHIGVPIRNNSSIVFGTAVHKYFSSKQIVARPVPELPDAPPDANPFDLMLEVTVGYHFMF